MHDEHGIYASRGAGAVIDAVRSARFLTRMTGKQAHEFGIKDRGAYFTVSKGKINLAPLPAEGTWRKIVGVPLGNGRCLWPAGDDVGVCVSWTPPAAADGLSDGDLKHVQAAIAASPVPLARDQRSRTWAGAAIAGALGWDIGLGAAKRERTDEQQQLHFRVERMIKSWVKSRVLIEAEEYDPRNGRTTKVIKVSDDVEEASCPTPKE